MCYLAKDIVQVYLILFYQFAVNSELLLMNKYYIKIQFINVKFNSIRCIIYDMFEITQSIFHGTGPSFKITQSIFHCTGPSFKITQSIMHYTGPSFKITSKCMALRSWAMFVHRTLEIDSGQKSKKIGFYPKSLRLFLRILCVVEDSIHVCRRNFSCAPGNLARN